MRSQLFPNIVSFRLGKKLLISLLFCSAFTLNALGQGEETGIQSDFPIVDEEISEPDGPVKGNEVSKISTPKESDQYKTHEEKEAKNGGMSTLSFNLFLYVVDRFKENK